MLNNIVKAGKKLKGYIQKWSADAFPFKLGVSFPRCEMKSAELVADAIKLQSEETKRLSLACAPAMLKIFRTDYHFCKVNFEKEYDQVINAVIFQFLLKLEPKLNQFFSPPCILNFIRAVANLLNQELWKVTKGFVIMDEEAILKFNDDRVKRKETNFRNKNLKEQKLSNVPTSMWKKGQMQMLNYLRKMHIVMQLCLRIVSRVGFSHLNQSQTQLKHLTLDHHSRLNNSLCSNSFKRSKA